MQENAESGGGLGHFYTVCRACEDARLPRAGPIYEVYGTYGRVYSVSQACGSVESARWADLVNTTASMAEIEDQGE